MRTALFLVLLPAVALAQAPTKLGYHGLLLKADGTPETGTVTLGFAVYSAASGGTALWEETQQVALSGGLYSTFLGEVTPLAPSVFDGSERFLEVKVGSETLAPRQRINSVAYALSAATARNVSGGTVDATSISVGGQTVIDSNGRLAGPAGYTPGPGLVLNGNTLSLPTSCGSSEVLRWNGTTWQCSTAGASAYQAGAGLALTGTVFSLDASGCTASGQVLKWTGTAWSCANDTGGVSQVATGNGLVGGPITGSGTIDLRVSPAGGLSTTLGAGANELGITPGAVSNAMLTNSSVTVTVGAGLTGGGAAPLGGTVSVGLGVVGGQNGGTGLNVSSVAPGALLRRDLLSATWNPLAPGATGQMLTMVNGSPAWGPAGGISAVQQVPSRTGLAVPDSLGDVGWFTSISIGIDGLAVVSYFDGTNLDLKLLHCGSATCDSSNTITVLDSTGNVGLYTSLAIGADGMPVISYHDASQGSLKVAKCNDVACSQPPTLSVVDASSADVGWYTDLAIGQDGLPVIAYLDFTNGDVKVAHCGNAACTSGTISSALDTAPPPGTYIQPSIVIQSDGFPLIAWSWQLTTRFTKCNNNTCLARSTVAPGLASNSKLALAVGRDGQTRVLYGTTNATEGAFLLRCTNLACSTNVFAIVAPPGAGAFPYVLSLDREGLPIWGYQVPATLDAAFGRCLDAECARYTAIVVDSSPTDELGTYLSMAIAPDGFPIFSYYDGTNHNLRVTKCNNDTCSRGYSSRR